MFLNHSIKSCTIAHKTIQQGDTEQRLHCGNVDSPQFWGQDCLQHDHGGIHTLTSVNGQSSVDRLVNIYLLGWSIRKM